VTSWSRGAESLFGWPASEAGGRRLIDLIVPEDQREAFVRAATEALDLGVARADDAVRVAKDGRRIPVAATVSVVRDEEGNPFGMVRILRDITRLKELDRMKSEFVQLVTHELRTPMTSVRGFAEALLEYGDKIAGDEARRYLEIILREANRLNRLVTDFLDASQLEAKAAALQRKPVDLAEVSKRVASTFEGHRAEVDFRVDAEAGLPLVATGDVHYLDHTDARAHEALLCIQSGDSLKNPNHWKFDSDQLYFKSPAEMAAIPATTAG
jgi:two-component system phosphate regulon sensor histidine kinase PhoR